MKNISFRYERKFRCGFQYYNIIKNYIELDGWESLYPDRQINNIYMDSLHKTAFIDSIEGHVSKRKYRIRWYGKTFNKDQYINNSTYEIKIKRDMMNYKKNAKLNKFKFNKKMSFTRLQTNIDQTIKESVDIYNQIDFLIQEPQFINSYNREYYISKCKNIRLTIDTKQKFYNLIPCLNNPIELGNVIIELKYNSDSFFKNFVIKTNLIQNSKFVNGINFNDNNILF